MKVLLISMPDVTPIIIHEMAVHMPNLGIASIAGNIDEDHEVFIIDLVRKRHMVKKYLTRTINRIRPAIVGLSAMTWQFDTCMKIARLIRSLAPSIKIVIGGYHATLMYEAISRSPDAADIDFMVRGEGEEPFRRLVNAVEGRDSLESIPSLSYKKNGVFVHNERAKNLDLASLKLPVRDKRRLTWGYHVMMYKAEVMETSRGCTRACNFCSIQHMYGRSFRIYPIERIIADIDSIYFKNKTRWIFIVDDNMVLNPKRVMDICDAIIERNYTGLSLVVQADCVSIARNEEMVQRMSEAGFKTIFLGIENGSQKNLATMNKGDIVEDSRRAIDICHKYGIMVIAGLIFGLPEDSEREIIENYEFYRQLEADASYLQILTPYPSTDIREDLIKKGLVTNRDDFRWYSGLWANVRTRHLTTEELQYYFWLHRQKVLGWWNPSRFAQKKGGIWVAFWKYFFRPLMKHIYERRTKKIGWEGRYKKEIDRLRVMNAFPDLQEYAR
ncbi:MAG: B12-binding domain-containing radical SAM protein [Spirochaetes bacterium]|nr:B12-binding domain-containing radical SAM protein [Spirochaetota bacterium]